MALDNTALAFTSLVSKQAVEEMMNEMVLLKNVQRKFSTDFKEVGDQIKARRPVYVESYSGAVVSSFDELKQGTININLSTQRHVPLKVTSKDLTLGAELARENFAKPAARELIQQIESDLFSNFYKEIYNFTGTAGTLPSTFTDVSDAEVLLTELGTPKSLERIGIYSARAGASLANGLKGVFPPAIAKKAIEKATMGEYAGVNMFTSNSVPTHTVGVNTGTPLVNGASQNVTYASSRTTWTQSLITDGWTASQTGILKAGDVFTIAGVNAVNRKSRVSTGQLQQFVVTADANSDGSGNATFTISPPIITSGAQQTVDAAPANNAAITVQTGTGGTSHQQNLVYAKDALAFVMAPLAPTIDGNSTTEQFEGVSVRVTLDYDSTNDINLMRFDVLYGQAVLAPDMCCRTTS